MRIEIPYEPRDAFKGFHGRKERFACIVAHRRAGKTVACINELIRAAIKTEKNRPQVAYIAPFRVQAKAVAWDYAKEFSLVIPGVEINESELKITYPNGGTLRLFGADNERGLRGLFLDLVILDEFADMSPTVWGEVIRPAISDREGGCVFIGTPKGRNQFYEVWQRANASEDWFALMLKASETGILPPGELELAAEDMTPEQLAQEYECSFEAAILGAYYGKEMALAEGEGRITSVPHNPGLPVVTSWDIGVGDSTSIWFAQLVGKEVHVIDHYEASGEGLAHYAKVLQDKPYNYSAHLVPHDALAREFGSGKSRIEQAKALGLDWQVVPKHTVEDGINAVRLMLPQVWFDRVKCSHGLEALRQYRTEWDDKARVFKDRPKHDWTSHAADSFRYMAIGWREKTGAKRKPARLLKDATFDDLIRNQPGSGNSWRI